MFIMLRYVFETKLKVVRGNRSLTKQAFLKVTTRVHVGVYIWHYKNGDVKYRTVLMQYFMSNNSTSYWIFKISSWFDPILLLYDDVSRNHGPITPII